jgi:1-acyl-sn-glycerol-3-phosphate acyltransferase
MQMGMIRASRDNAEKMLRSGAVVIVFPGGDYDALRPTSQQSIIDFNGRMGYVTTAIEAGAPIVPAVSIGGQETQLFLTRGAWLAKRLGLKRLTRTEEVAEHSTCRFPPRSSRRSCRRSTSPPSSVTIPTSPRSTHTCAR